eukprot:2263056-Pyramimonas_sp.AAC.1
MGIHHACLGRAAMPVSMATEARPSFTTTGAACKRLQCHPARQFLRALGVHPAKRDESTSKVTCRRRHVEELEPKRIAST